MNYRGGTNNYQNSKPGASSGMNHRSYSNNSSPYAYGTKDQRADEVNRTMLEQDNDQRWLELGEQVSLLKSVSNPWISVLLGSLILDYL
jgi:hypothetical protein